MRNHIHFSATLDKDLSKRVNMFCRQVERSKSWLVSKAIKEYLDEMEDLEIAYQRLNDIREKPISLKEFRNRLHV